MPITHKDRGASDDLRGNAAGNAAVRNHAIEAATGAVGVAPDYLDSSLAAVTGESDLTFEERQAGKDVVSQGD